MGKPTQLFVRVTAEGKTFSSNAVEVPTEPPVWNFRLIRISQDTTAKAHRRRGVPSVDFKDHTRMCYVECL